LSVSCRFAQVAAACRTDLLSVGRAPIAAMLCATLAVAGCASFHTRPPASNEDVRNARYTFRLLGVQTIAHRLQFDGTTVGGLSGIDRDPVDDLYYLISDDRSQFAPTRFYTARLAIDDTGFHAATLAQAVTLRPADGSVYAKDAADSEAIRFDPVTRDLWWASEGARKVTGSHADSPRLIDPFVRRSRIVGSDAIDRADVPLAPMFHIVAEPRGPRDNLVFEGLALSIDLRSLWVAMEAPLLQDGPMPTMTRGAWSRFSRYDRDVDVDRDVDHVNPADSSRRDGDFGPLSIQYAYRIDPIRAKGAWTASHAQTGVSEILAVDATHLFVLERAFAIGAHPWHIRLFEADFSAASDVKDIDALNDEDAPSFAPMTKQLVLDFDTLGIAIDNLEGLCFGPTLPNGHRTLVLVSDDNFNALQTTQLLALEIIPR